MVCLNAAILDDFPFFPTLKLGGEKKTLTNEEIQGNGFLC